MSRRHTNLADVPSGVSQIIIKLSFGNVKKETFYRQFEFPVEDGFLPAEELHQSRRSPPQPAKKEAHLPDTLGTRKKPPFCKLSPLMGKQFLPTLFPHSLIQ